MKQYFTLTLFLCTIVFSSHAQDLYTGKWDLDLTTENFNTSIKSSLIVGKPENNLLYPAQLNIICDSFTASYKLLLVKKNTRQLAISRNKTPITETPFSLQLWTVFLNGTFDFSKDIKGNSILSINRIPAKKYGLNIQEPNSIAEKYRPLATMLYDFLKDTEIRFKKNSAKAWEDEDAFKITQPKLSNGYYGIIDTLFVSAKTGTVKFNDNKDIDIISVGLNGSTILDQIDSKKKRADEDVLLDTGLNIITLFADDFGKNSPSSASVELIFDNAIRKLDFNAPENIAANFIVAKVYNRYDEKSNTKFDENYKKYEQGYTNNNIPGSRRFSDSSLNRNGKIIGNIVSKSEQITFAIWDDAVEDGDTISLSINDTWIAKNFPVKKKPQFITITLKPGPNIITFVAENLGSIIPNTSVLEIIDGNKRKSFFIETDLNQNNLVKIFYDFKGD